MYGHWLAVGTVQYYVPPSEGKLLSDNWMDITLSGNETEFDTEKSVELLERIIGWVCPKDQESLVMVFLLVQQLLVMR
jgi:adenine-specific DNA-methyltransferase